MRRRGGRRGRELGTGGARGLTALLSNQISRAFNLPCTVGVTAILGIWEDAGVTSVTNSTYPVLICCFKTMDRNKTIKVLRPIYTDTVAGSSFVGLQIWIDTVSIQMVEKNYCINVNRPLR